MNPTPGPWTITKIASPDYAQQFGIYAGPGPSVALVVNGNSEANAKLIASAPDLLIELIFLREEVQHYFCGFIDLPTGIESAIFHAGEVIDKATGKTT